jgi:putative SOS response-associated peptidase YedK
MCYDVTSGLKALIKYARHRHDHPDYIASLEKKLQEWIKQSDPHYHASGFSHPQLLVFTNTKPFDPQAFNWGLIPAWVKDKESALRFCNQTLNARAESIFEKPSFKQSAKNKRCLVYVDGFFEYHQYKGKSYPFYITAKDDSPLAMAGLYDEWVDKETGEVIPTVSIVTTRANTIMTRIHNNPKQAEARMPVILPKDKQEAWLTKCDNETDKERLLSLCVPLNDDYLQWHTVRPLKGKSSPGDVPDAIEPFTYPELSHF